MKKPSFIHQFKKIYLTAIPIILTSVVFSTSAQADCEIGDALDILENRRDGLASAPSPASAHPGQMGHRNAMASQLSAAINMLTDRSSKNDSKAAGPIGAYINRIEGNVEHIEEVAGAGIVIFLIGEAEDALDLISSCN